MKFNKKQIKGIIKCKLKKRFNVGFDTEKPPQRNSTIFWPIKGNAENKLIITVAPQKLICPQGNTYPKKAAAIINIKMIIPDIHKKILLYKKEL